MLRPYHFIIADDEHSIVTLLHELISEEYPSARVYPTHNGELALDAYDATGADLLILDIQMPFLTGVQVVQALRARGDTVPILLISAALRGRYDVIGDTATMFCIKPFEIVTLFALIAQLLPLR